MKFVKGQRIRCIDPIHPLKDGAIYIVGPRYLKIGYSSEYINIILPDGQVSGGWMPKRFKLVSENQIL